MIAIAFIVAMPSASRAALINATVVNDTPTYWSGYVDWTTPGISTATLDIGPNWSVAVSEFNLGGGLGFLSVSTRHIVEPDGPGAIPGLFLSAAFGPLAPGSSAVTVFDSEPHEDHRGHFDLLRASLARLSDGTSRLSITLEHAPVPEPSTIGLFGCGLAGLISWRRRTAGSR